MIIGYSSAEVFKQTKPDNYKVTISPSLISTKKMQEMGFFACLFFLSWDVFFYNRFTWKLLHQKLLTSKNNDWNIKYQIWPGQFEEKGQTKLSEWSLICNRYLFEISMQNTPSMNQKNTDTINVLNMRKKHCAFTHNFLILVFTSLIIFISCFASFLVVIILKNPNNEACDFEKSKYKCK